MGYANKIRENTINEENGNLIIATSNELLDYKLSRKRYDSLEILYKSKIYITLEFNPETEKFYIIISKKHSGVKESKLADKVMMAIQKYLVINDWIIIPGSPSSPEQSFVYDFLGSASFKRRHKIEDIEDISDSLDDFDEEEQINM